MTKEEAISRLEDHTQYCVPIDDLEAFEMALDALCAQQVPVKLDRSRWEGCRGCKEEVFAKRMQYMRPVMAPLTPEQALMDKLTDLTGIVYIKIKNKFCPFCGHPLTEEAWAELERRIGGNDGTTEV